MAATQPAPTRFVVIVPRDIRDRIVPKQSEAFGLYTQLSDAVTCNVPNGARMFGLVFGGKAMSHWEWAQEFRMTERSFQRVLAILKDEKLVVVDRGRNNVKLAITDSIKKTKRHSNIAHYPWVTGDAEPPEKAALPAFMAVLPAEMAALEVSKNEEVPVNAMPCGERDGQEEVLEEGLEEGSEERTEEGQSPNPKSSPQIFEPNPTASPTLDEVCVKLYGIGREINKCQPTFSAKYRAGVADLLTNFSVDEVCEGYREFVENFDDFQMRNAPKSFAEGGGRDVINSVRERKRRGPQATGSLTQNYQEQIARFK